MKMIDIDIFSSTDLLEIVSSRIEKDMNNQQKSTFQHKALNDVKHAIKMLNYDTQSKIKEIMNREK
jgi:oligoribonuclease (3'-5' exoribonuclease)